MAYISTNPFTGKTLLTQAFSDEQTLLQQLQNSYAASKTWRQQSFAQRAKALTQLGDLLLSHKQEAAKLISLEMGKPILKALGEIEKCASCCEYYSQQAQALLKPQAIATEHKTSELHFQAIGPVIGIMPWNFPFWQVIRFIAPNLMAGNTVLIKHAENVPQCAAFIGQLCQKVGINNAYQNLWANNEQTAKLIASPLTAGVTVTGSVKAGSSIGANAGKHIKPHVLELGGSDPFIVLADCDLEKTAEVALQSRFNNCGQVCVAAKRFIVEQSIEKDFTKALLSKVKALKAGDPLNNETELGPMAKPSLRDNLQRQIDDAIAKGANCLVGGQKGTGFSDYPATVLTNINDNMAVFKEEVFGPVACITTANDTQHALELAQQSNFGLSASIWSQNEKKAKQLALEINAGSVFINALPTSHIKLPFGGHKGSGYGRELGELGIKAFVNAKTLVID